jgi:peptidoglycan/xylan/chitin deacetylase (PgdA/CDA1 family)
MPKLITRTKTILKNTLSFFYFISGYYKKIHKGKLLILTYHRVLSQYKSEKEFVQPGMYVGKDVFEKQIQFLQSYYTIISFSEYLRRVKMGDWESDRQYCIITFDDGWKDNYDYAFPILTRYNIPATIFLAISFIGTNQWFWPERVSRLFDITGPSSIKSLIADLAEIVHDLKLNDIIIKSLQLTDGFTTSQIIDRLIGAIKTCPPDIIPIFIERAEAILGIEPPDYRLMLNWDEVREMSVNQISFGSHGCTHRILTLLSDHEIKSEVNTSITSLKEREVNYVPVFCYPNGNYNYDICNMVSAAGYHAAVTTHNGLNRLDNSGMFSLHRVGIHNDVSKNSMLFSLRLSGF